ncbi:hypothetical protein COLO4_14753 [Corchorus olitorius]|uniref:non-specific serine/threonine protein kinase n=1 Tax=Corchorus olitorius TaxID=93759 RepID=A0A1R3JR62_9ROSI|nr:hypothetical protein COLO4_14753 [Corchorus olitorius]
MCLRNFHFLVFFFFLFKLGASSNDGFTFNGIVKLGGVAEVRKDGLYKLTDDTKQNTIGHAFYSDPFTFKNSSSSSSNASSFSTTFVFAIVPWKKQSPRGNGMGFVLSPSKEYLTDVSSSQHVMEQMIAVEFDTIQDKEVDDINDNHVGINVHSLNSTKAASAGYVNGETGEFEPVDLASGELIHVWVEYDGLKHQLNVTLSPVPISKPKVPLLSLEINLSPIVSEKMYVGFSSTSGTVLSSKYVLGWSFQMDGEVAELDLAKLPSLPDMEKSRKKQVILAVVLSLTGLILVLVMLSVILFLVRKKDKFTEILEDWEVQFGLIHRYSYKELSLATQGFNEEKILGQGGFGKVFKGELPVSKEKIAVKRISHNSDQGMKEFIAEIGTIGKLRRPNLVRLLGYCRALRPRMSQVILYLTGQASLPESFDAIIQTSEFVKESSNYLGPKTTDSTIASITITESFQLVGR